MDINKDHDAYYGAKKLVKIILEKCIDVNVNCYVKIKKNNWVLNIKYNS